MINWDEIFICSLVCVLGREEPVADEEVTEDGQTRDINTPGKSTS